MISDRAQRKRVRRLVNDQLVDIAPYWTGKIRPLSGTPIDRVAKRVTASAFRATRKKRVYLVRFMLHGSGVSFLKIGISGMSVENRFKPDLDNYQIETLATSVPMRTVDARAVEAGLLRVFSAIRHRPTVRLLSGNTECFAYSEATVAQMKELFLSFRA